MRAASQLLQEGCISPWAKAVPELPGKLHLGPAACKCRGSAPGGLLAVGSELLQMVNGIQRHIGELQTKRGSLLASGRTWAAVFRGVICLSETAGKEAPLELLGCQPASVREQYSQEAPTRPK